jgi:hypothetical protein
VSWRNPLPDIAGYNQYEVTSALRKTIKLGLKEDAIYWLNVLLEGGDTAKKKAARNLWIMAAEDIDEPMIAIRAYAVFQMISKVPETDHLYFLVAAMCSAPKQDLDNPKPVEQQLVELTAAMCEARKWWETKEGRDVDELWSKAIGDLKVPERRKQIPEVALDQHTQRGKALARARGGQLRNELSGTDEGRAKTVFQFLAAGRLDKDVRILDSNPVYQQLARYQRWLQGKIRVPSMGRPDVPPDPSLFDVPPEGGGPRMSSPPDGEPRPAQRHAGRKTWNGDAWTGPHGWEHS